MFKKLRNKILLLNLAIISIMMLLAFSSIYIIMYENVTRDVDMELHRLADFPRKSPGGNLRTEHGGNQRAEPDGNPNAAPSDGGKPLSESPDADGKPPLKEEKLEDSPPLGRSISFSLLTDGQGEIVNVQSRTDMGDEFYSQAMGEALAAGKDQGKFKLNGHHWAYVVQPFSDGRMIAFLDITSQQAFLTNLVYAFLAVAAVTLIIIFFISRFFANRSIQPVQEAFERQKQFIADASHELKTPLTVINTNVDVLMAHAEDTIRSQSKWLSFIQSESDRMSKLTNDLLYLAQIDQAQSAVMAAPFSVSEAVEQVVLTMEAVIYENNISLTYEMEPGLTVRGSCEQIKQVVMILLDNALKYTNPNGSVELTLKKRHHSAVLTVTNSGEGIAEEHLERIFDRFYRTDPSRARKHGGYGLGLAIAKAIIDRHRGSIHAKSVKNEGVSFFVELPVLT